jgi:hypothetical protein
VTALNLSLLTANTPSTSGSYTFSVTRDQIIRQMMLDIGALQEGEVPTAQETTDCAFKLNMMVKQWMSNTDFAPGLKVWTRKRADLFLSPTQYTYQLGATSPDNWVESTSNLSFPQQYGQTNVAATVAAGTTVIPVASVAQVSINDYFGILIGGTIFWTTAVAINAAANPPTVTIPAPGLPSGVQASGATYVWNYTTKGIRPVVLVSCILRDIYANDTPIRIFRTVEEYEALPTKTSQQNVADPTAVFYEARFTTQNPSGRIFLDVGGAQDVTKHLHCVYLAAVQDFVNPGDAPDYPQEWYEPLVWGLGKRCCGMFDCAWSPDMEQCYVDSLAIAKQGYPQESSVYFQVEADDPYGP